jgi:putative protease
MNASGFKSLILSSELSGNEIKQLVQRNHDRNIDLEMIVNGNLEVIVSKDDFTNLKDGKGVAIFFAGYMICYAASGFILRLVA